MVGGLVSNAAVTLARVTAEPQRSTNNIDVADLEQALTLLAWSDPAFANDPDAALARLGVEVPNGLRLDVRVQRRDTLYLVIPPAAGDGEATDAVVNQMDLWRSGDQFVWILRQDAKVALLQMREQYRAHGAAGGDGGRAAIASPSTTGGSAPIRSYARSCWPIRKRGSRRTSGRLSRVTTASRSSSSAPTPSPPSFQPLRSPERMPQRLSELSGRIFDLLHSSGVGGYLIPDEALTWVLRDMRALWAADPGGPSEGDHGSRLDRGRAPGAQLMSWATTKRRCGSTRSRMRTRRAYVSASKASAALVCCSTKPRY